MQTEAYSLYGPGRFTYLLLQDRVLLHDICSNVQTLHDMQNMRLELEATLLERTLHCDGKS